MSWSRLWEVCALGLESVFGSSGRGFMVGFELLDFSRYPMCAGSRDNLDDLGT